MVLDTETPIYFMATHGQWSTALRGGLKGFLAEETAK